MQVEDVCEELSGQLQKMCLLTHLPDDEVDNQNPIKTLQHKLSIHLSSEGLVPSTKIRLGLLQIQNKIIDLLQPVSVTMISVEGPTTDTVYDCALLKSVHDHYVWTVLIQYYCGF
jgi:hypothetical protein